MKPVFLLFFLTISVHLVAQNKDSIPSNQVLDSLFIGDFEKKLPPKVLHAEPLYIDLIRDLGARKGEKEWNVGMGLMDNQNYDEYEALIEYEWAPLDRLGLEVELPFSFYYPVVEPISGKPVPQSKLNSLKVAGQYTFLVSEKQKTSLAVGYIHEFELPPFARYSSERLYVGNVYNPFFIAAKRWGQNFHTLIYAGPQIFQEFSHNTKHTSWQVNSNIHYMIPGTRNFIGIEFNKDITSDDFDMIIRPQMRVSVMDNFLIGIVTGIPVSRENQRFSSFLRLIYEPGHR
jgi:hypothetical protein